MIVKLVSTKHIEGIAGSSYSICFDPDKDELSTKAKIKAILYVYDADEKILAKRHIKDPMSIFVVDNGKTVDRFVFD